MTLEVVTTLILVFIAGPIAQQEQRDVDCLFPGDCLRHAFGSTDALTFGTCASRSTWREQFILATPEERVSMWKTRHQTMDSRIIGAYQLKESQKRTIRGVIDDSYAAHREVMGEAFSEMVNLRRATRQRLREYDDEIQRLQDGGDPARSKVPLRGDDPVWSSIEDRKQQIKNKYPFPWDELLDRIDKVLPKEQAEEGRRRLAEQYPHGFSAHVNPKKTDGNHGDGGGKTRLDRWEAYLQEFVARHELAGGQPNAANSIMREMRDRAAHLTSTMQKEIARSPADEGAKSREVVMQAFQFDLDDLFGEFAVRLDALLASAQRDK